jgi:ADP-heptose:LPS heptosyltransferase
MQDGDMFSKAMKHFEKGEFNQCYILLKILAEKYKDIRADYTNASSILQLYCAYEVISTTMGRENPFVNKMTLTHKTIGTDLLAHAKKIYCMALLHQKEYKKVKTFMPCLQEFTGPNIKKETMSYFQPNDRNKTLLIYNSGGIGDIIMYGRFIRRICESQSENKIIFVVNDNLVWLFQEALLLNNTHLSNLPLINLQIIDLSSFSIFPKKYDYHTNITMLFIHLKLTYDMMYIDYYLEHVKGNVLTLENYIQPHKKNIVINWCGNKSNIMEKFNRSIPLADLIPLFINYTETIEFISIQKNVSPEEAMILDTYKVKNYGSLLDNTGEAFKDTVTLLKEVDLVITTDTSLVHLAGTMNVPCWCLLTIGCDWRWTYTDNRWYPNVKTFRQNRVGKWDNVIVELTSALSLI